MDAQTVIEAYVRDVTARLPGRERADVAMELRALLGEELAARSQSAGRPADEAMAMELIAGFGTPAQAAQRYRPATPLLDPADTRVLVILALFGCAILPAITPLAAPHAPRDAATTAVLVWLGMLFVSFAARYWLKRHWPKLTAWKPRDPDKASRFGSAALVAVIALGVACYGAPAAIFTALTGGARLPATLVYDPAFAATRLPWLLAVWVATGGLYAWIAVAGRWRPATRIADAGLEAAVALALVWFMADGPVMQLPASDHALKPYFAPIAVLLLLDVTRKAIGITRALPPRRPNRSQVAA